MSTAITEKEDYLQVFDHFDLDGDGKISLSELRHFLVKTIGDELSLEDAKSLVEHVNPDGSEMLDFDGFIRLVERINEEDGEEDKDLVEAFKMYDTEGEGCITAKSLKRMLSRLGTKKDIEECKNMICTFDLNGDEVLTFDEFKAMML